MHRVIAHFVLLGPPEHGPDVPQMMVAGVRPMSTMLSYPGVELHELETGYRLLTEATTFPVALPLVDRSKAGAGKTHDFHAYARCIYKPASRTGFGL